MTCGRRFIRKLVHKMIKKYIDNERGRIFYWDSGQMRECTIIFFHGLTADHTLFDCQLAFWTEKYRVITWDMPLHGESRPYRDFSFANAAEDLRQIMEKEEITHAVLAGQSAGGYVAQAFVQYYPEMADAFISIDSTPFGMKYYKKSELFWTDHYSAIARIYPYKLYCRAAASSSSRTEKARQSFYESLCRLGKKGMMEAADAYYKELPNCSEVIFPCPVLLILGEYDRTGYVSKYTRAWSRETGYPLLVIPDAAHNSNYDNPEFFNQKTEEFIAAACGFS
ncbi:UNVERIFIED_CONTAM: pimeloyl-ACP methyl ester carboxylesterase [Murimonas intestini]|uniref:Pimeloyl-ACP methyl ester carboxylesterase n=2 Tax=Murimonas intestini TaxID=1337051 RepID=A0AB73T0N2_9FIRM